MMKNVNVGDIVYAIESCWNNMVISAKVTKVYQINNDGKTIDVADVKCLNYGHDNSRCIGTTTYAFEQLFASAEEVDKFRRDKSNNLIENYKKEITDVASLIQFAINHCIACAEEYTDWEARTAYCTRAKELGFPVSD